MTEALSTAFYMFCGLMSMRFTEVFAATLGFVITVWLRRAGRDRPALMVAAASALTLLGVVLVSLITAGLMASQYRGDMVGWLVIAAYIIGPACHIPAQILLIWAALAKRPHEVGDESEG